MHRALAAALSLVLSGCVRDGVVSFRSACADDPDLFTQSSAGIYKYGTPLLVDPAFDDGEVAAIRRAADDWHEATAGLVTFPIVRVAGDVPLPAGRPLTIVAKCQRTDPLLWHDGRPQPALGVMTMGMTGVMALDTTETPRERWHVLIAHEMGHRLGLGHVQDDTRLMFPTIATSAQGVTPADVTAWVTRR